MSKSWLWVRSKLGQMDLEFELWVMDFLLFSLLVYFLFSIFLYLKCMKCKCQTTFSVIRHLDTNHFYFILFYFSDFTFLFLYFIFLGKTMKQAHDKEVTWQVTWCDVISLEHGRRVWKMTSGHMEYTWWPWVGSEADMRMEHGL